MPLITVINDDESKDEDSTIQPQHRMYDDDIDEPPPLSFHEALSAAVHENESENENALSMEGSKKVEEVEGPTLMEELMKDAHEARVKLDESKRGRIKKESKCAFQDSKSGFKKGFLMSNNSTKKKGKSKDARKSNIREEIIEVRPKQKGSNQCVIDEVQKEMERDSIDDSTPSLLRTSAFAATEKMNNLVIDDVVRATRKNDSIEEFMKGSWATKELMQKISENPKLKRFLMDPQFAAVLRSLEINPKETMKSLQNQPEMLAVLNEFCSVMGGHFSKLADDEKQRASCRKMGPLEKQAVENYKKQNNIGWDNNVSKEEKERVNSILADRDLSKILMDPDMQKIILECSSPGRMHYFMRSEEYGPKLRKLMEVGLLKIEH